MPTVADFLDKWAAREAADKLLHSLVTDLSMSGKLPWKSKWFGIYAFEAKLGIYTFSLLKSSSGHITIYINTKGTDGSITVDGKEVWYFLKKRNPKIDQAQLIKILEEAKNG